jgi:hypothetical protein
MIPVTYMHPPARHSSRLGQRFQVALGAAAALAAISLSPGSAQAYVVTVGGVQYDVSTFTGSYNDNIGKFRTPANGGVMPWWSNESLANAFSTALAGSLGFPNPASRAPLFAWVCSSSDCPDVFSKAYFGTATSTVDNGAHQSRIYATATLYTPVPGPLPLFGAAAAFGFSRQLRKRIKLAPAALGSALPQA